MIDEKALEAANAVFNSTSNGHYYRLKDAITAYIDALPKGDNADLIERLNSQSSRWMFGSLLTEAAQALQRMPVVSVPDGWKPITEDTPRDGTQMLLWSPMWEMTWGVVIGHFEGDGEGGGEWVTSEGVCLDNDPDFDPATEYDDMPDDWDGEDNTGPTKWFEIPDPKAAITRAETAEARLKMVEAENEQMLSAINWACGANGDFSPPDGAQRFWWRGPLTEKAGLEYDSRTTRYRSLTGEEG